MNFSKLSKNFKFIELNLSPIYNDADLFNNGSTKRHLLMLVIYQLVLNSDYK